MRVEEIITDRIVKLLEAGSVPWQLSDASLLHGFQCRADGNSLTGFDGTEPWLGRRGVFGVSRKPASLLADLQGGASARNAAPISAVNSSLE
jgi:hypothetical protein